jgi:7-carboxy-7-deazaguanine synthase
VVTGGEPLIAPEIAELTTRLRERGLHITIETAGTVDAAGVVCDLMSISPKLANSTPEGPFAAQHERLRIQPDVLRSLTARFPYQLKFVVAQPTDLDEIRQIATLVAAPPDRVLLMPEGIQAAVLRERSAWLASLCKSEGYRYCPRLHIELFGNQRGT